MVSPRKNAVPLCVGSISHGKISRQTHIAQSLQSEPVAQNLSLRLPKVFSGDLLIFELRTKTPHAASISSTVVEYHQNLPNDGSRGV